jgi:hypothetical protein
MKTRRLESLRVEGLPLNWTTLLVGWRGPGKLARQLSAEEVSAFALERLSSNEASIPLVALATAGEGHTGEIAEWLQTLADDEGSDPSWEERKWRLILLEEVLAGLGADPVYDLIKLTEFWEQFDYPLDSPHVVQGARNNLTPTEYYTLESLRSAIEAHRSWIEVERSLLRGGKAAN